MLQICVCVRTRELSSCEVSKFKAIICKFLGKTDWLESSELLEPIELTPEEKLSRDFLKKIGNSVLVVNIEELLVETVCANLRFLVFKIAAKEGKR